MNLRSLRDRVEEWGPLGICALLSLGAFYLLILYGASLSRMILLGVMLICPAIYFTAWLLGGNSWSGGRALPVRWEADARREQATWSHQPAPLIARRGFRSRRRMEWKRPY